MTHPFIWLSDTAQKRSLLALAVLSLGLMGVLQALDSALRTDAAPYGILSFELAGNLANAQAMVTSWDEPARVRAALSLGFD